MSLKVDEFINSLNEEEQVYLYKKVTNISYIGSCADEMRRQTTKFLDENFDPNIGTIMDTFSDQLD